MEFIWNGYKLNMQNDDKRRFEPVEIIKIPISGRFDQMLIEVKSNFFQNIRIHPMIQITLQTQ